MVFVKEVAGIVVLFPVANGLFPVDEVDQNVVWFAGAADTESVVELPLQMVVAAAVLVLVGAETCEPTVTAMAVLADVHPPFTDCT